MKYLIKTAASLCIGLLYYACSPSDKDNQTTANKINITESVYASIKVTPAKSYFPQSVRSGIIKEILIEEGDKVKAGSALARIAATTEVKSRVADAQLNLKEAELNYSGANSLAKKLELEIQTAKRQVTLDSLNYTRSKNLWDQNIGKKSDYEKAELIYESSKNKHKALSKQYAQVLLNAKTNYQKALNRANSESELLNDFVIYSEISGMVYTINKKVGEFIGPQERLAEIGSEKSFTVEMNVDEADVVKVAVGDTAVVSLDAYEDQTFLAIVTKLYPKKDEKTQTFLIDASFISPPQKLFNGLSGEANIVVDRRNNALVVPSDYLINGNKLLTDTGEVPVQVGVKNLNYVEIVSGINVNTVIIKPVD